MGTVCLRRLQEVGSGADAEPASESDGGGGADAEPANNSDGEEHRERRSIDRRAATATATKRARREGTTDVTDKTVARRLDEQYQCNGPQLGLNDFAHTSLPPC